MNKQSDRRQFLRQSAASVLVGAAGNAPSQAFAATSTRAGKPARGILSDAFLARLPQMMEWANTPGLSVAIVKEGRVAWQRGFGVKKAGTQDAVTDETLFPAASLSKPVFAYGIFKLREEKLIDLDRPLIEYLPKADLPDDPRTKLVTARHALSHSTGWQNWRFRKDDKLTFAFAPGEKFSYSGEGYFLLQRVVEQITGRGFQEFMRERVLAPLGMKSSTYTWTPECEARATWGHTARGAAVEGFNATQGRKLLELAAEWKKPLPSWKDEDAVKAATQINGSLPPLPNFLLPNSAASLLTTAGEYAQFLTRLMEREPQDGLSAGSRRAMFTQQVKINSALGWGLGWGLEQEAGRQWFWHWGDNGNFKAFALGEPARRFAVVVLTNGANGHRLWQRIVAEAAGPDHAAFLFWMV